MGDVVEFTGFTKRDVDPHDMLAALAENSDITHAVVIAERADGKITLHTSKADGAIIAWWLNLTLMDLYRGRYFVVETDDDA